MNPRPALVTVVSILIAGGWAAAQEQVHPEETTPSSPTWDEAFTNVACWTKVPEGNWRVESSTAKEIKHTAGDDGYFLGNRPKIVRARTDVKTGAITRIEVIWDEIGLSVEAPKDGVTFDSQSTLRERRKSERLVQKRTKPAQEKAAAYLLKLAKDRQDLERGLRQTYGAPVRRQIGSTQVFRTTVSDFDTKKGVTLRLWTEEETMVMATLERTEDLTRKLMEGERNGRREMARENVRRLTNDDIIIENIPMHEQGARGYCAGASELMVMEYWGLELPVELVAAKYKVSEVWLPYKVKNWGLENVIAATARECGVRTVQGAQPLQKILREIEAGHPVLVGRFIRGDRQALHTQWKEEVAKNPDFKIPDPKSAAERNSWARQGDSGHGSIISGYNPRRREFLLTESWGENARNQRMSYEELLFTCSGAFTCVGP